LIAIVVAVVKGEGGDREVIMGAAKAAIATLLCTEKCSLHDGE